MRLHPLHLAIATFLVGVTLDQCPPAPAYAQQSDAGLMLARVFVNEAGFDGAADHLAIANYTRRLARHYRAPIDVTMVRRYTRALAPESERRDRVWIANLSRDDGAPRGWPEANQRWADRDAQWRAALDRADAFLRGEIDAPPGCRPHSWGSPDYDAEAIARTIANGGFVVNCGPGTKNVFLRWHP